jgi:hypothetical protein
MRCDPLVRLGPSGRRLHVHSHILAMSRNSANQNAPNTPMKRRTIFPLVQPRMNCCFLFFRTSRTKIRIGIHILTTTNRNGGFVSAATVFPVTVLNLNPSVLNDADKQQAFETAI